MTKLFVVSTPIGNLSDISLRALEILKNAELIICENTLKSKVLLDHYQISVPRLTAYNDKSTLQMRYKLINQIKKCAYACLISDAGTPLISDPGYKLIQECYVNNIIVDVVPGATALIAALTLAGMATDNFAFLGFVAKTGQKRSEQFMQLPKLNMTVVFYETPVNVLNSLQELHKLYPTANMAVCKELTKLHQKCYRGSPYEIYAQIERDGARGEYVMLIDKISLPITDAQIIADYACLHTLSAKDIAALLEIKESISKNRAYGIALEIKSGVFDA